MGHLGNSQANPRPRNVENRAFALIRRKRFFRREDLRYAGNVGFQTKEGAVVLGTVCHDDPPEIMLFNDGRKAMLELKPNKAELSKEIWR